MDQRIKIEKRTTRDGRLRYLAMYATPQGGFRSAGTFGRRIDAVNAANREADKVESSNWADPRSGKKFLDAYVTEVWVKTLPGTIERKTLQGYLSTYKNHIKPTFGEKEIGGIRKDDVKIWISQMETGGTSRSVQWSAYRVLSVILHAAKDSKVISGDLAVDGVKPLPAEERAPKALTPAQWKRLLAEIPVAWQPLCQVAVATGMRLNELRALCPLQVEWDHNRICVNRGVIQVSKKQHGQRFFPKAYPKGRRARLVQADEDTLGILFDAIDARGLEEKSEEPIFQNLGGGYYVTQEDLDVMFRAAAERAGLKGWTFKDLRSTCASWDLKRTGDIMFVKNKLGHASITTTEKHYLAVVQDDEEETNLTSMERFRQRKAAS